MRISNELQKGKAGEYLVCADLILKGFIAFPSEQGLPYDVVLDNGKKIIKIQVKTTSGPREMPQRNKKTLAYIFNIKRNGKGNKSKYKDGEIDVFALVALDVKEIAYVFEDKLKDTVVLRVDSLRGTHYDEIGIINYQKAMPLKGQFSQTEIASKLGLHVSQINRFFTPGYKPHKTRAKYFSEYIRTYDWFEKI